MIETILERFNLSGGKYVSWKNNHELDLALSGKSDLDIYVPLSDKSEFLALAKKENWVRVVNPVADYPEVYHFYTLDKALNNYHLHVYFKVITGESWLKEYNFPLGDFLLENKIKHSSGVYILNSEAQAYLFVLRHFIKGSSFFSRLLYQREIKSYKREWDLCKEDFKPDNNLELIDFTSFIEDSHLLYQFKLPTKKSAKKIRQELKQYLRLPSFQLGWLRLMSLKARLFNKLFYKEQKLLPVEGFILAFSGADGVGKSTMSKTISEVYGQFLTIKEVQLGKPQSVFMERLRKFVNKSSENQVKKVDNKGHKDKSIGLKKAVSATVLAYLRFKEAKKAWRYKKRNYLVFSDRWPTKEYGKMDGPQLNAKELKGIKKRLALIEQKYYKKIPKSDLSIVLTVPTEIAIQRNRDRIKEGKETDEEIKTRHIENAKHRPKAKEMIRFDNNDSLIPKREELIKIIQSKLFEY